LPGNTNADSLVDINDILPIGIYWNQLLCERSLFSNDMYKWSTQPLLDNIFLNNNCISHADANGDGKVNIADILAIMVNWGKHTLNSDGNSYVVDESCTVTENLSRYYSNFSQIYNSLEGNSNAEVQMRKRLEELFGFSHSPTIFQIYQNYPNPFNPSTSIPFHLSTKSEVSLAVFDLMGRRVIRKGAYVMDQGSHEIIINGHDLTTGVYFYQFTINGDDFMPKKMVLLK